MLMINAGDPDPKAEAKALREAEKAAAKEKKDRIKANKPKKDPNAPNIFARIWQRIKKFFKDFRGTCKKVVWPDAKTVWKSFLVVLVITLFIGVLVWVVDWGLGEAVSWSKKGAEYFGTATTAIADDVEAVTEAAEGEDAEAADADETETAEEETEAQEQAEADAETEAPTGE